MTAPSETIEKPVQPEILDGVVDHITGEKILPKSEQQSKTLYTQIKNREGEKFTIPRSWTMSSLVSNVMKTNKKCFTNILVLGLSTSGKTSFCRQLMHKIHTNPTYPEYNFKWFHGEQVMDIPKIVEELEPGMNYVCVFDDISYVTDAVGAKKKELGQIGKDINRIRHHLKGGRIIIINCVHYMAGAQKGIFRDCMFTVATSITQNASEGLKNIFGNEYLVNQFSRFDRQQNMNDRLQIPVSKWDNKYCELDTNSMKIGLVSDYGHTHYFVWQDESCEQCNQDYYKEGTTEMTAKEFVDKISNADGKGYNISNVRKVLRMFAFIRTGDIMHLPPGDRHIWRLIADLASVTKLPLTEIIEEIDSLKPHWLQRKKKQIITQGMKDTKEELFSSIADATAENIVHEDLGEPVK
ncbi:MAG: hypothetical protein CMI54_08060 [Parcubacteria group bacterium]|jgi:GTPase SAR1 family protein|nr:hypothetical protein [Parcubacteria group bacterium]|tara:strand:+ start:603 stop:1832 length:1230 start_codon:yes stop_codon:yes gene_type:complete